MIFESKLPDLATTIFTRITQLAEEYKAINLGQGFPDFMMDDALINLVNDSMKKGINQYSHTNGNPLLRNRIAAKVKNLYDADISGDQEITITAGGTYAIYNALTTLISKGDEVILFDPSFDSYVPNIEINGGIAIRIPLNFPNFDIPWDLVRQKISSKTKAIILNSPHNPSGAILQDQDMQELQEITKNGNIFIISDEVYEHLIYDEQVHRSLLRYPELMKRTFMCSSFGKTYHCTGWKIGYCIAPPELTKEFRKTHQFNTFCINAPIQAALAEYIVQEDAYLSLGRFYQEKRDYFQELMESTSFEPLPSYGTFFQCYSYKKISNEADNDFALRLIKEKGVATIPLSNFYEDGTDNKILRFCFAKEKSTLLEAARRLTGQP
jgi:methionine aminotransferase